MLVLASQCFLKGFLHICDIAWGFLRSLVETTPTYDKNLQQCIGNMFHGLSILFISSDIGEKPEWPQDNFEFRSVSRSHRKCGEASLISLSHFTTNFAYIYQVIHKKRTDFLSITISISFVLMFLNFIVMWSDMFLVIGEKFKTTELKLWSPRYF